MKSKFFLSFFLLICMLGLLYSCKTEGDFLERYYLSNTQLHSSIASQLSEICIADSTKAYLSKRFTENNTVRLYVYFKDSSSFEGIEFDSLLIRTDRNPKLTSHIVVPISLIKNFKASIYHSVSFENEKVFFAYKEDNENLFARDVSFEGILISNSTLTPSKKDRLISPTVAITTHYLP